MSGASSFQEAFEKSVSEKKGKSGYTLVTSGTGNGSKIAILAQELGIADQITSIPLPLQGEQKEPWYNNLNVCPNGRVPCLIDHSAGDLPVWQTGAILMYLAEKHGKFIPKDPATRARLLTWLFYQTSEMGPMAGQVAWYLLFAPVTDAYAIQRYINETKRITGVLESLLASDKREWILGSEYSIADITWLPSIVTLPVTSLDINDYPAVKAWRDRALARPAVQKGFEGSKSEPLIKDPKAAAGFQQQMLAKAKEAGALDANPAGAKAV